MACNVFLFLTDSFKTIHQMEGGGRKDPEEDCFLWFRVS